MTDSKKGADLHTTPSEPMLVALSYVPLLEEVMREDDAPDVDYCSRAMGAQYGFPFDGDSIAKPFAHADGTAFIPVHGSLLHRSGYFGRYSTGYDAIRMAFDAALADDDIDNIVFDVNSGGGMVAGAFELADHIYNSRGAKPITAIVDASAYSAAYLISSACDKIYATRTGGVGSIGVVTMHLEVSGAMERWGEKVTFMYAGARKIDGNPYQELSKPAQEAIQGRVDGLYEDMTAMIARNVGLSVDVIKNTEAACFGAAEAVIIGLVDAVKTPQEALASLKSESSNNSIEDFTMSEQDQKTPAADDETVVVSAEAPVETPAAETPAAAPAAAAPVEAADTAASERIRISAIIGCEEAKGRKDLAEHFAFNTSMTPDEAKAALAKAPVASAPIASGDNGFSAAMDNSDNPNVGADGGQPAAQGNPLVSALVAATGAKTVTH